jgi:transposase
VEGRTKAAAQQLCTTLNEVQRAEVNTVCTDMWEPFIEAAQEHFINALHCHDNFHLVSYLNKAVDKVRRREVKEFDALKRTKYLWLKDTANFTELQRLRFEVVNNCNYEVSRAWRIKENFRDIVFRQPYAIAEGLYEQWVRDARQAGIKEIIEVVDMFERHREGIINAITTGCNNARAERVNGAIQEIKTIGRGYRKTANFRTAILFWNGNLNLYPHKNL